MKPYREGRGYPITTLSFIHEQAEDYSKQEKNINKVFPKKIIYLRNSIILGETQVRSKSSLVMHANSILFF